MTQETSTPTYHTLLNGQFCEPGEARISLDDAGFQHGIGLFETLYVQNSRVFRGREHLSRLANSARELGLLEDLDVDPLLASLDKTIEHNHLDRARLRLTLTAGAVSLLPGREAPARPMPTLAIQPSPVTAYDPQYFEDGVLVLIAPSHVNPLDPTAGHKTLNYWQRLRSLRQAAAAGAGEAVWLSVTNHLASGAISNLFLVRDDTIQTPIAHGEEPEGSLQAPVLPGVTRGAVLECAEALGITAVKAMLTIDDLLTADEVFLTNSGWQVLPVTRVERSQIGDGRPGPVTGRVREAVLGLIERETAQR
ncbi:aminotransferase class IV [Mucisphaera calidilacus]|uniref:branched-chain-amino-acid transaminase n=1 Tax=Mucisphaera calidilacus TaxID=2527982 RepID=A0A518BWV1_9BACT|nr:aminotransferase class IV [Mucisphaera calidilacus]QDU71414.1 Branched-chain-amino-acid aminotransferase [Mucisphaera calidilacus]